MLALALSATELGSALTRTMIRKHALFFLTRLNLSVTVILLNWGQA